jgi:hypothetical protein
MFLSLIYRNSTYELQVMLPLFYIAIIVVDIFWLVSSCYYAVVHAKSLKNSDRNKFESEKFWFLSFLALLPILMINWVMEFLLLSGGSLNKNIPSVLADLVKLLTAVNIFVIFIDRKNVKMIIFEKYRAFNRSLSLQST